MTTPLPPWLPPALSWTLIQTLTGLTVTFTQPNSLLRPLTAAATALLAYTLQITIKAHYAGTPASGPLVAMTWVSVLNGMDLLLLTRVSYAAQKVYADTKRAKKEDAGRGKGGRETDSLSKKLFFAFEIPYNYRRINTPWQITRLPTFPVVPSKTAFLRSAVLTILITSSLIILIPLDPSNSYLQERLSTLHTDKRSLLLLPLTATLSDLFLQARFTLSFGIVCRAAILSSYTLASILAVGFGGETSSWPPVFEGVRGAGSLRGVWGQSWHQLFRRPLTSPATYILSLISIPPQSKTSHWTRVLVAFIGSGIIHALCDIGFGVDFSTSGGLWFFALQIPGLIIESVASFLADKIGIKILARGGVVRSAVGYIWVAGYLLWSAPLWVNPILVSLAEDGTKVMSPWFGGRPEWFV